MDTSFRSGPLTVFTLFPLEGLAGPRDPDKILVLVVLNVQLAMVRMFQRFADAPGEVGIRGEDDEILGPVLDRHNTSQGISLLFLCFGITDDPHHLIAMLRLVWPFQGDEALGVLILDAEAGRTSDLFGVCRLGAPCPATFLVQGSAGLTDGRLLQLAWHLV
ncbi:MAG: hypothetical protein LZF60_70017 [Nitrospira sp.]|nr:MAG: hypothetical protein LZF60_70017 [Nitrospira sp.]